MKRPCPELGTGRKIASLSGVAPHPRDSEKSRQTTKGSGRPLVKSALFMATLSSVRYNPIIREYYERKLTKGGSKLIAMVACMNKMVSQLNSIMKRGEMLF
jgi:transposase